MFHLERLVASTPAPDGMLLGTSKSDLYLAGETEAETIGIYTQKYGQKKSKKCGVTIITKFAKGYLEILPAEEVRQLQKDFGGSEHLRLAAFIDNCGN